MLTLLARAFSYGKYLQNSVLLAPPLTKGVPFLLHGEEYYSEPDLVLRGLMKLIERYPLDDTLHYSPPSELFEEFRNTYTPLLVPSILGRNSSCEAVRDLTNVPTLSEMITAGPGAVLCQPIGDDRYAIDLTTLSHYEVRPGFLRYGGRLTFDATLSRLELTWDGITITPDDYRWPTYEFYFRSSLLCYLVVKIHACHYHIRYSRYVNSSLANKRLAPFLVKNLASTDAAWQVLFGEYRYFHRLYAFTAESLDRLIADTLRSSPPLTFQQLYASVPGLHHFPYFTDGMLVWDVLSKHFSLEECGFIFNATVNHEVIGNTILRWQASPCASAAKLTMKPCCDDTTYRLTMLIAAATTLGNVPMLLDVVSDNLREDLLVVERTIEKKNANRLVPYYGALPSRLESTFNQ